LASLTRERERRGKEEEGGAERRGGLFSLAAIARLYHARARLGSVCRCVSEVPITPPKKRQRARREEAADDDGEERGKRRLLLSDARALVAKCARERLDG
jgi:hypothetical protein